MAKLKFSGRRRLVSSNRGDVTPATFDPLPDDWEAALDELRRRDSLTSNQRRLEIQAAIDKMVLSCAH